jgi:hypothetical protein
MLSLQPSKLGGRSALNTAGQPGGWQLLAKVFDFEDAAPFGVASSKSVGFDSSLHALKLRHLASSHQSTTA